MVVQRSKRVTLCAYKSEDRYYGLPEAIPLVEPQSDFSLFLVVEQKNWMSVEGVFLG